MNQLRSFMSGYFHEDWPIEASSADEVLHAYLARHPSRTEVLEVETQIRAYVATKASDEELERCLLSELGCYYLPSSEGRKARDWLLHVIDVLEAKS